MPDYSGFNTTDPVINAETRSPIVYTVCITFGLISLAAVILRLYTRIVLLRCKRLGADDVAIIIAEVTFPWVHGRFDGRDLGLGTWD